MGTRQGFAQEGQAKMSILDSLRNFRAAHNIRGSWEHKTFSHLYHTEQDRRTFRQEGILELEYRNNFTKNLFFFLGPKVHLDNAHFAAGIIDNFLDNREENRRYAVDLKEGYFTYYGKGFDLSFGKKIYAWGKANAFNPTDNLNPRDYLDVLENEKISITSASLSIFSGPSTLEFVFVPTFTPSRLPPGRNRWAGNPMDAMITGGQFNINNFDVTGNLNPREIPERNSENVQFGMIYKTTHRGWDFSLSCYDGFEDIAAVKRQRVGVITSFTPFFNKVSVFGFDFSTTFGELGLAGEYAQTFTNGNNDDDYFQYITGGNYSWYEKFGFEKISVFLEWAGELVTSDKKEADSLASAGYSRPFQNSLLGKIIFKLDEDTEIQFGGTCNLDDEDYYIQQKTAHKFTDEFKFELGIDVLDGRPDSFLGKWRKNDRIFTKLTYSF